MNKLPAAADSAKGRYSPAECIGAKMREAGERVAERLHAEIERLRAENAELRNNLEYWRDACLARARRL